MSDNDQKQPNNDQPQLAGQGSGSEKSSRGWFGYPVIEFLVTVVILGVASFFAAHAFEDAWKRLDGLEAGNRSLITDFKTHRELEVTAHEKLTTAIQTLAISQNKSRREVINLLLEQERDRDKKSKSDTIIQLNKIKHEQMLSSTELSHTIDDLKSSIHLLENSSDENKRIISEANEVIAEYKRTYPSGIKVDLQQDTLILHVPNNNFRTYHNSAIEKKLTAIQGIKDVRFVAEK